MPQWERKALARRMSDTLDHLFMETNYDKKLRPDFGGPPTVVDVNMVIRSMGPVDEQRQMYTLDVYFR